MLSKECFTAGWIEKIQNDNAPADPTIIEKTICPEGCFRESKSLRF